MPSKRQGKKVARASRVVHPPKPLCNDPSYTMVRAAPYGELTWSASDKGWTFNTDLAAVAGYAEFTALFKYYRIKKIVFQFTLFEPPAGDAWPSFYLAEAQIGAGAPATFDAILQQRFTLHTLTSTRPNFTKTITWPVYETSQATTVPGQWQSTTDTDNATLGLAGWIVNGNTSTAPAVSLLRWVTLELNGLK